MAESIAAVPLEAPWRPSAHPWLVAASVMSATFMEVLDTTIVIVAMPHIAGNLSATTDEATWVLTSYLVANAVVLPATGWLSRVFGRKRFLMVCIVLFTLASMLCGIATSLPMLILARIFQGVGGGALQPISQAVLMESFPPHRRGAAMALFGFGVVVAPIIGPTLGGWLTDNYSWRWVFYLNLPVGLLAVFLTNLFLEDPPYIRNAGRTRIDFVGLGLLVIWVGAFQIFLDRGQIEDWLSSSFIRVLAAVAVAGFIAFVAWELWTKQPVVNLRLLRNRNFAVGTTLMSMVGVLLYGSIALLPLFLQTLLGYPALQSGLVLSPARGLGAITGMILMGRILGIVDARYLIVAGFSLVAYSTWQLGALNLDIAPIDVILPCIVNGFATALIFVPLTTETMATVPNEQMGNATGIFNLMRNMGGSMGIAIVATLLTRGSQAHQALMVGHLAPDKPAYQQAQHGIAGALHHQVGLANATAQSTGVIYAHLLQQASLWSFVDDFRLLAVSSLACLPFVLLLRKAKAHGPLPPV